MAAAAVAKIALEAATYAIDKPYDYRVPELLADRITPGIRVVVPFGPGNRRSEGIVLALKQESSIGKLKSVLYPLDEAPVLDEQGIRLALWMREQYFCTVYEAARCMLPAGLWYSLRNAVSIADGVEKETAYGAAVHSDGARRLLDLLYASGGSAELGQIKAAFEKKDPNPAMRRLLDAGIVKLETGAKRRVGDKTELKVTLLVPAEEALAQVAPKRKTAPVRYSVIELLCAAGSLGPRNYAILPERRRAPSDLCQKAGSSPWRVRKYSAAPTLPACKRPDRWI